MRKNRKKPESELGTERKKPITEAPKSRVAERRFIALMVFAWLWRIISGMIIGTLVLTTSLLSVLIALIIQIVVPIAVIVFAVKLFTKKK